MNELTGAAGSLGWVALKALLMFSVTVLGLRLAERRTLAQLGAFDFAVAVAVGALIARTATSSTTSFLTGAVGLVTLLVAHRIVTETRRRGWTGRVVDAPPRVLIAHGRLQPAELARAGLTPDDVFALLREHGAQNLDDVQFLLYETRGAVTLVRRDEPVGELVREGLRAARYDDADASNGASAHAGRRG